MKTRRTFLRTAGACLLGPPLLGPPLAAPLAQKAVAQSPGSLLIPDPSWTCGMPEGIPRPESGAPIFEASMKLDAFFDMGKTPYGNRRVAVIQDGLFSAAKFACTVMSGALDLELRLANGAVEIEQLLVLQTGDGKYIFVRAAGTGPDSNDVRIAMDFEAPNDGSFAWLNSGKYVARRVFNESARTLSLKVYDVSNVTATPAAGNAIRIVKPPGVSPQPWDFRKKGPTEKQGRELITESVTLSPSQSVGPSKRGNRNVIPIAGGELKGRISGKVLRGGADYQNLTPPATIDARYLWQADGGEVILVRNAGPLGALTPAFEVRTDGSYAWLNKGIFLSSNPGLLPGGVGITMYESAT